SVLVSILSFIIRMATLYFVGEINLYLLGVLFCIEPLFRMLSYLYLFNKLHRIDIYLNRKIYRELLFDGKYLIASGIVLLVSAQVDKIIVGNFLDDTIMANYAMSFKFLSLYILLSTAINLSYVSRLDPNNENYLFTMRSMLRASFGVGLFLGIVNYISTPHIIDILYGDKFQLAGELAKILSPMILFSFITTATGRVLVLEGLSKHALYRNAITSVIVIPLAILLIQSFGVEGIAYVMSVSGVIGGVLYLAINSETRQLFKRIL
ncbi:TPA: oligosaccharide flippase family protein, partial [Enterobacter hormaechei subsp. steigerwaltii]|nr:oligosaccharide flippase family protein [Enterobacter hormaechei subsp. steigerwaltii]